MMVFGCILTLLGITIMIFSLISKNCKTALTGLACGALLLSIGYSLI